MRRPWLVAIALSLVAATASAGTFDPSAGDGGPMFIMFGGIVLVALVGGALLVRRTQRARVEATAPAEAISLLVAEPLARETRTRHALVIVAISTLVGVGWAFELYPTVIALGFVAFSLDGYLKAHRIVRELAKPNAGAELRATRLTICTHDGAHYGVRVSRGAIERAKRHAIPTSIAR